MTNRGAPTGTKNAAEAAIVNQHLADLRRVVQAIPTKTPRSPPAGPPDAIIVEGITQAGHGFVVGNIVYGTAGGWVKARSNAVISGQYAGMVSGVTDTNTFTLTLAGIVNGLSALSQGVTYYLSDATAGAAVAAGSLGADALRIPVFLAVSSTQAYLFATSAIAADLSRLTLGHKTLGGGTLKVNFATDKYLELASDGAVTLFHTAALKITINASLDLVITYADTNVVQLSSTDFGALTGATVKLRATTMCDPASGTNKSALVLRSELA